jgi:hypothetical protein
MQGAILMRCTIKVRWTMSNTWLSAMYSTFDKEVHRKRSPGFAGGRDFSLRSKWQ